ncbi:MAG TPA: hypothetical protein VFE47_07245 [Tepidisphaeraceae bacterium]|nr:hypothetical protein [Tepidisphaeraceae bacterium]
MAGRIPGGKGMLPAAAIAIICLFCHPLLSQAAAIHEIDLHERYLAFGRSTSGTVVFDNIPPAPAGAVLRVSEIRDIDLPAAPGEKPGEICRTIVERPIAEVAAAGKLVFNLSADGILAGAIHVRAEIIEANATKPISAAWSEPIEVGIRAHLNLAGKWNVTKIEPYSVAGGNRPANWKPPEISSATLPGIIVNDEFFRGWVTLHRTISWSKNGGLQPRFLRLAGVADSAAVTIDQMALPETRPIEDMAVLSHWIEFHSRFKGEQNAKTRMLFLDLPPQGPVKISLPAPLPPEGSAQFAVRLRSTSGMFRPHPAAAIRGDLHLDLTPPVYVRNISFDASKPGEDRRFTFRVVLANETSAQKHCTLRALYGQYDGSIAYTGNCPLFASEEQQITLNPGLNGVSVTRNEKPRFNTCRATFVLVGDDGKILDGDGINYHTVTFEVRDRRDFYLNNERFIFKAQGSSGDAPHKRWQLRIMGGNGFRGPTDPAAINLYQSEGLLTSAGGALLASVEKCTFYNPQDTSNIDKAVRGWTTALSDCPGVIMWEATNELHGEPEEARVAILDAFHKYDPYHRPVLATKGSGEWEAEARDGRVKGVDIVGCQYLLSKEGVDSITAAVTEQPIMSTEVNWNDMSFARDHLWQYWLEKGIAGSLLFDYSGGALDQPAPAVPPPDNESAGGTITRANRDLYQDLIAAAKRAVDGRVQIRLGNQMPYTLHSVTLWPKGVGKFSIPDMAPGAAVTVTLPAGPSPLPREPVILRAEYTTHGGLPHVAILTPIVSSAPASVEKGGAK